MEDELISIVIPIYKVEKYLDRCIESVVKQTYSNLEIILIDDGSPDRCPLICEEWAMRDTRIRVIHKENAGLGMARNTGIDAASGQYICFIDSDDYIVQETLAEAYEAMLRHQAELVTFGMMKVDRYGEVISALIPKGSKACYRGIEVQEVFLPDWIDNRNVGVQIQNLCLSACSCLYSMELIRRANWKFVSERELISEDSYSLIQLAKEINCVAVLEKALYCYCDNETSLTRTYRPDRFEKIQKFYEACSSMAGQQGYTEPVQCAIAGVTLSFVIAAMKQIVESELSWQDKKKEIKKIIFDDRMSRIVRITQKRYSGYARKLLMFAMRNRRACMTMALLDMQVRRKHR